jgi:hypothetical protein
MAFFLYAILIDGHAGHYGVPVVATGKKVYVVIVTVM